MTGEAPAATGGMPESSIARLGAAVAHATAEDPDGRVLLTQALAPAIAAARTVDAWPVVALPAQVAAALGADEDRRDTVVAACIAHFASADVIDDAQDGDLDAAAWGEPPAWREAVTAGVALAHLALQVALDAAAPVAAGAVADVFGRTGVAMSLGQRRDLAQRGAPGGAIREADYLACLAGKSGASFALYASLAGHAMGAAEWLTAALEAYGRGLGMALQLASDMRDARATDGRDRRNQVLTLPVIRAWERLAPGDRPLLLAAWRGEPDAVPLAFLLERSGAMASCAARLAVLRTEALMALDGVALPAGLAGELEVLLDLASPGGAMVQV